MCCTMCITNSSSASASTGEISATRARARPPANAAARQPEAAAGPPSKRARRQRRPYATAAIATTSSTPGDNVHEWSGLTARDCGNPGRPGVQPVGHHGEVGWASIASQVSALVAPPRCAACAAQVAAGEVICPDCRRGLPWLRGPRCRRCALPVPCRPCPAADAAFERAWTPMAYAGTARELVTRLKFGGALGLVDVMAAQIAANAPQEL